MEIKNKEIDEFETVEIESSNEFFEDKKIQLPKLETKKGVKKSTFELVVYWCDGKKFTYRGDKRTKFTGSIFSDNDFVNQIRTLFHKMELYQHRMKKAYIVDNRKSINSVEFVLIEIERGQIIYCREKLNTWLLEQKITLYKNRYGKTYEEARN